MKDNELWVRGEGGGGTGGVTHLGGKGWEGSERGSRCCRGRGR